MKRLVLMVMVCWAGAAQAGSLCSINAFTAADAAQGKVAFDSHCALCHQYNMRGRIPGNYKNESPDINLLSDTDLQFLDHGGGAVPPLIGDKFFREKSKMTLVEFSTKVAGAANSFPSKNFEPPKTYFQLAAYVLYRNCGRM